MIPKVHRTMSYITHPEATAVVTLQRLSKYAAAVLKMSTGSGCDSGGGGGGGSGGDRGKIPARLGSGRRPLINHIL